MNTWDGMICYRLDFFEGHSKQNEPNGITFPKLKSEDRCVEII